MAAKRHWTPWVLRGSVVTGRPPKPTAMKLLEGNPGKRPIPEEREIEHGAAKKPAWLAVDPLGSMVWDELAPGRIAIGLLTSVTSEEFAYLCRYIGDFRRSPMQFQSHHLTDMRAKLNAFGFNPSALAKLGIATGGKKKRQNPFAELSA